MKKKYLINDEAMTEFCEYECDGRERGLSVMDVVEMYNYSNESGRLIKKYGEEAIRDEFIKRCKEFCEENDEEYYDIMWR